MSERDKREYAALKADPERYATYLKRKARERKARVEYERSRKARWRANNPEATKRIRDAGHAVERALRIGRLHRPRCCQKCGEMCKVEAHHHRGYAEAYWLDIEWLCPPCHQAKHALSLKTKGRDEKVTQ